jgi:hypothetical protein
MFKISKNIEIPIDSKKWISDHIFEIKNLIAKKHSESKDYGFLNSIILPEKLILKRKYDAEEVAVAIKISPEDLFVAKGWTTDERPFAGWADASTNEIFLNANALINRNEKSIEFLIIHEIAHLIDPKLYRENLNVKPNAPYYEKPHEVDALSVEMSEILRFKYSPGQLLDMLRSGDLEKNPRRHPAIDNFRPEDLRRFKLRLYHDIISDIEKSY